MELNIEYLCGLVAENDLQRFAVALLDVSVSKGCGRISFAPATDSPKTIVELCMGSLGTTVCHSFLIPRAFSDDFQAQLFGAFWSVIERRAEWERPNLPEDKGWRVCRKPHQDGDRASAGRPMGPPRLSSEQLPLPAYARGDTSPPTKPSGGGRS